MRLLNVIGTKGVESRSVGVYKRRTCLNEYCGWIAVSLYSWVLIHNGKTHKGCQIDNIATRSTDCTILTPTTHPDGLAHSVSIKHDAVVALTTH